jgi:uncharacterized spore protein YtfJ
MDTIDSAISEARNAGTGRPARIINALGERLGQTARVETVFGAPIERDGVTVIPVARTSWMGGGGGGGGSSSEDGAGKFGDGEGGGAGGRASAKPAGFIRIVHGDAEFVPIPDPAAKVRLILAGAFAAWLVLRAARKLVR